MGHPKREPFKRGPAVQPDSVLHGSLRARVLPGQGVRAPRARTRLHYKNINFARSVDGAARSRVGWAGRGRGKEIGSKMSSRVL